MLALRKAEERGHANHGWLNSYHSFSFAYYYDPQHTGFRKLRVINEDRVKPNRGFDAHPHRDMEIISYVLEGALAHKDSMGNSSVISAGEVQIMSAGTGIIHSEFNPSQTDPVHFLQIWIFPNRTGLIPSYDQKLFTPAEKQGKLRLILSPDGRDGSLVIHQDVNLYATMLSSGEKVEYTVARDRYAWVQITQGEMTLNGLALKAGDGVAISEADRVVLEAQTDSEALLFDLN